MDDGPHGLVAVASVETILVAPDGRTWQVTHVTD